MQRKYRLALAGVWAGLTLCATASRAAEYVWIEAEHSTDVGSGYYFSNEPDATRESKPGWNISGPGIAAEWTQGGESEWTSVAAHAGEARATLRYKTEVPTAGRYRVWVRYADYQGKKEEFRVRVQQGAKTTFNQVYGASPVVPEGDEVKLMWGWAFGWGSAEANLEAGAAEVQVMADAPTEARRQVDTIVITDDMNFRPLLREKPAFAYWAPLEAFRTRQAAVDLSLATPQPDWSTPGAWRTPPLAGRDFSMLFNMPTSYWKQKDVPEDKRVLYPYFIGHGAAIEKAFLRDWGGKKDIPIWSSKLNIPIISFGQLAEFLADDAPFLAWLKETKSPFGILLNYQLPPPNDNFGDKSPMIARNLASLKQQFVGYMSGENIGYAYTANYAKDLFPLMAKMPAGVAGREQVLNRIHEIYTEAFKHKFSRAYATSAGAELPTGANPWEPVVSALSTDMFPHIHALAEWGERTLAHEATANDPAYALRWAFLRGASRQFGRNWVWYQSSNFGDTATTFVPGGNYAGPFANYYHSHYDAFSGAGLVWYRKAYFSTYMAGAAGVYLEQGFDQYFVPSPGPDKVILSPFGRITDEFMRFAEKHPDRGVPYTPVAFLLDSAHGWYHYENQAGAFSMAPQHNPAILGYSRHDAMIRDWFNIAYYPVPKIEGEPLMSPRLSFINSPLGDIFDVLVTSKAPKADDILKSYRAVILSGDVRLSESWGRALREFVEAGGTLVATDDQVQGPGAKLLDLPTDEGKYTTSKRIIWRLGQSGAGESLASNTFRYRQSTPEGTPLATAGDGKPVAVQRALGKGKIIWIGIPKGLGLDDRATPLLSKVMLQLRQGLLPIEVKGDVEYSINRNATGWVVTLMNNRGNYKSQHGLGIPRREESASVTITGPAIVDGRRVVEWTENAPVAIGPEKGSTGSLLLEVPAGDIRIIHIESQ